jgi:hypothetical protein
MNPMHVEKTMNMYYAIDKLLRCIEFTTSQWIRCTWRKQWTCITPLTNFYVVSSTPPNVQVCQWPATRLWSSPGTTGHWKMVYLIQGKRLSMTCYMFVVFSRYTGFIVVYLMQRKSLSIRCYRSVVLFESRNEFRLQVFCCLYLWQMEHPIDLVWPLTWVNGFTVKFIGGGARSTWRKRQICSTLLTNFYVAPFPYSYLNFLTPKAFILVSWNFAVNGVASNGYHHNSVYICILLLKMRTYILLN